MKNISLILFLLWTLNTNSQTWAPVGAIWHNLSGDIFNDTWYSTLESVGDSIIQGKNCKVIQSNAVGGCTYGSDIYPIFLHHDSDRVYYYNEALNKFCLLYDFTLLPNDTLYIQVNSLGSTIEDSVGFVIDSIGFTDIDTNHLRTQYLTPIYSPNNFSGHPGKIIEFLGHTSFLFPIDYEMCDISYTGELVCYSDTLFNYHNPYYSSNFCSTIGINEININNKINVFPNPTADFINLDIDKNLINQIKLYDIFARLIMTLSKSNWIDLSALPNGIYFIEITNKNNFKTNIKVIKNAS